MLSPHNYEKLVGMLKDTAPTSSDRTFGLVMAGFFTLLALIPWWKHGSGPVRHWLIIATLFAIFALARPAWLHPLHILWFRLGLLLQKFVSPIVLGIIFFALFTPFGWLVRRARDPLRRKWEPSAKTYWIERDPSFNPGEGMRQQF